MQIEHQKRGDYLLLEVKGRLDATWSDFFEQQLLEQVRMGHHRLVIEAGGTEYLSSAGIRSLMKLYKELLGVQGSLCLVHSMDFVKRTLESTGLGQWLEEAYPADMPARVSMEGEQSKGVEVFMVNESASLHLKIHHGWQPWQAVQSDKIMPIVLDESSFALGVGATLRPEDLRAGQFGEFVSVAGNLVYQPPDETSRPDYLISENDYFPRVHALQALLCQGEMSHLIRFSPGLTPFFTISDLACRVLEITASTLAGFVILGEIEGLVGVSLIRSPAVIEDGNKVQFPELRNWLMFCGERCHSGQQALVFGVVSREQGPFFPLNKAGDLFGHCHAAVFPYQPLQNGNISLVSNVRKFFNASPPVMVMHLLADNRVVIGLGESSFKNGACWCAPINNPEVLS